MADRVRNAPRNQGSLAACRATHAAVPASASSMITVTFLTCCGPQFMHLE
jgi:hypothetical protein